jgi:predicted dehydrogenase
MKKINTAVIGVGHMGKEHARILARMENCELVGVYDIEHDTSRRIAQQHGVKLFETIDEAIEAAEAISIATPTTTHFEVGMKCLEKGRHILLEKPMTETTDEALQLVKVAKEKNLIFQVGHIERFNPVLKALEERLTHPRFIEAHRLSPYPGRSTDISVIMDLMIHDLEIILHLVKSPVKHLDAVGISVLSKSEDIANVRIRFESGCIANITTSRISPEKMRKIRVFQEDAYLSLDYQKQEGEIYRKMKNQITREKIPVTKEEPLKKQLESFINCVGQGQNPVVSGDHASEALKLAARIMDQIRSQ